MMSSIVHPHLPAYPDWVQSSSDDDDDDAYAEQDPQLVEAAAHLGDEAGAPEHSSEQLSDAALQHHMMCQVL
jgi:hypothetical protein